MGQGLAACQAVTDASGVAEFLDETRQYFFCLRWSAVVWQRRAKLMRRPDSHCLNVGPGR